MSWRKDFILPLTILLAAILAPNAGWAYHDQGYPCYQCHSLKPAELRPLSRAIRLDENILGSIPTFPTRTNLPLPGTAGYPISCDYCHRSSTDVPTQNMASKAKKHPVDLIQTGDLNPVNEITCNDCHAGGAQDLVPSTLLTKTATDGYPDHKGVDNVYAHNLVNNKPHLTQPYWSASSLPGLTRANDTTFWTAVQSGTQSILCWQCHDGTSLSPYTNVRSTKVVRNDYVDGNTATAKGHKIRTFVSGALGVGTALPCYDCHDSHGSTNNGLILDTNSIYDDGTSQLAVSTYNQPSRPYLDLVVCAPCHDTGNATTLGTKASGIATMVEGMYPVDPYNSTLTGAMHIASGIAATMTSSTKNCLSANGGCHANPHNPVGESKGGQNCAMCHNTLYEAMNAGTATGYHHVMLGDNAPIGGNYPNSAAPAAGDTANRTCLICHVDHDYFSKLVDTGHTRAQNLRRDITVPPDNGANAPLRTDYDNTLARGGICTSCHENVQTKSVPGTNIKNDGVGTTALVSKTLYGGSAHNYPSGSPYIQGHFSSDNADAAAYFQANCSKCHNDTAGTGFQDGVYKFGLHASDGTNAVNNLLAPMGYTPLTDNLAANFCYRCHSHGGQLANGKAVDAKDYYNNANMDNAAESTYTVFNRTSKHPLALVDCLSCHNVHATRSATGSIVANPDNTYAFDAFLLTDNTQTGKTNRVNFCLKCHDTTGLTQTVSANTYVPKAIAAASARMNKVTNGGRGHWSVSGSLQAGTIQACDACHDKHGSSASALLGQFDDATGLNRINGVAVSATVTAADNAAICGSCHTAAGLGYPAQANPTVGAAGTIMVFEGYRLASSVANPGDNGYFSPTPSGSVTTPRWPGMATWNASPHNTAAKNGPAVLGGRPIADCNGCHDPHGTPNKFNMLTDNLAAGNYRLCFDCHDGVVGAVNIKQFFPVSAGGTWATNDNTHGHKVRTAGGRLAAGTSLPCYDCHVTHGSRNNNTNMLSDQRWNNLGDTLSTPSAVRIFCLGCHATSDATPRDGYGNNLTASDTIEGLNRIAARPLRLPSTIGDHAFAATAGCYNCHGSSYADNTSSNVHNPGLGALGPDVGQYFDRKIVASGNYADNSSHPLRGLTDNTAALLFGGSGSTNCLGCHHPSGPGRTSDECLKCHYENNGGTAALGSNHMDKQIQLAAITPGTNTYGTAAFPIASITDYDNWCLQCHNATSATSLGGVAITSKAVTPAAAFTNGRHRADSVGCIYCHQPHGRGNAKLIRENADNRRTAGGTPMRFGVFPNDNLNLGGYGSAQNQNFRARQYWADNSLPYLPEADDDQSYCNKTCHVAKASATYNKDKIIKRDGTTGNYLPNGGPTYRKVFVVGGVEYTIDNAVATHHQHPNGEIIPTDSMVSAYGILTFTSGPSYYQYPLTTSSLPSAYNPATSDLPFSPDYLGDGVREFTNAYNGLGVRITYRLTCSTCHNPHGTTLANAPGDDGFPDLRLPRANPSTLCQRCHK